MLARCTVHAHIDSDTRKSVRGNTSIGGRKKRTENSEKEEGGSGSRILPFIGPRIKAHYYDYCDYYYYYLSVSASPYGQCIVCAHDCCRTVRFAPEICYRNETLCFCSLRQCPSSEQMCGTAWLMIPATFAISFNFIQLLTIRDERIKIEMEKTQNKTEKK